MFLFLFTHPAMLFASLAAHSLSSLRPAFLLCLPLPLLCTALFSSVPRRASATSDFFPLKPLQHYAPFLFLLPPSRRQSTKPSTIKPSAHHPKAHPCHTFGCTAQLIGIQRVAKRPISPCKTAHIATRFGSFCKAKQAVSEIMPCAGPFAGEAPCPDIMAGSLFCL